MGTISTQIATTLSKTGFLRSSLIVSLNFSSKTALKEVQRIYLRRLFLFEKPVTILCKDYFPWSFSIKLWFS